MKRLLLGTLVWLAGFAAPAQSWKGKTERADYLHRALKQVTDVMVYDIYSPPVTSRTYAYVSVAAYEVLAQDNRAFPTLAGRLHGLTPVPTPDKSRAYSPTLAAVHALILCGKALVISEQKLDTFEQQLVAEYRANGLPDAVLDYSLTYGQQVASHIITWSKADKYHQTRSLPLYRISPDEAAWKPTPPAYIKAVEPHWNKLRTFVLDSARQFSPPAPPAFSTDTTSAFYKTARAVYAQVNTNSAEQVVVANFWDCNPFKMNVRGHVMFATKKISPNGHWMNIARQACQQANASAAQSAETYALLAVTMADCLISCWDEKYRSAIIRPETYINRYISPTWRPVLQTPPFPEYTSGHSVVSSAAAVVLTKRFGESFAFADSTEVAFGLPVRRFASFWEAAQEAAISRFWGGIHYMPAITNGQKQGEAVGAYVMVRLNAGQ